MRNFSFYFCSSILIFLIISPITINGQNDSPVTHEIIIKDFSFSPTELKIEIGDIVLFKWLDSGSRHNVEQVSSSSDTSYDSGFRSGDPQNGPAEWILPSTFVKENTTLYYICNPHVVSHNMRAKIIVGDDIGENGSSGNLGFILAIFAGSGLVTFAIIILLQKKNKTV